MKAEAEKARPIKHVDLSNFFFFTSNEKIFLSIQMTINPFSSRECAQQMDHYSRIMLYVHNTYQDCLTEGHLWVFY